MHVTESKLGGGEFEVLLARLLNYIDVSSEEMIPTVKTLVPKIFDAYGVKTIRSFFFGKLWGYMDNGCFIWSFKMYHKSAIAYFGANFVFITRASPKSREKIIKYLRVENGTTRQYF